MALSEAPRHTDQDWSWVHALALRETRRFLDPEAAQDAAQEAALRAWRHRNARTGPNGAAWVRTIARREALRMLARHSKEGQLIDLMSSLAGPSSPGDTEIVDVRNYLQLLPPAERQVVLLRYWGDRTDRDIAQTLGVPVGTVKVRLHRARHRLRTAIEGTSSASVQ